MTDQDKIKHIAYILKQIGDPGLIEDLHRQAIQIYANFLKIEEIVIMKELFNINNFSEEVIELPEAKSGTEIDHLISQIITKKQS